MSPSSCDRLYNSVTILGWAGIGALWGTVATDGLARLGGKPLIIIVNDDEVLW